MGVFVVVHASVAAIEIMSSCINLKWTNGIIPLHFVQKENIVPQWAFKLSSSLAPVEG
jgi:aromatic ring-opening dioxygenase LigB subunit